MASTVKKMPTCNNARGAEFVKWLEKENNCDLLTNSEKKQQLSLQLQRSRLLSYWPKDTIPIYQGGGKDCQNINDDMKGRARSTYNSLVRAMKAYQDKCGSLSEAEMEQISRVKVLKVIQ